MIGVYLVFNSATICVNMSCAVLYKVISFFWVDDR